MPYYRCSSESTQALRSETTEFLHISRRGEVGWESEGFTLCHWGVRTYRGNLEDSNVYTQMEKIIPLGQSKKNQQLREGRFNSVYKENEGSTGSVFFFFLSLTSRKKDSKSASWQVRKGKGWKISQSKWGSTFSLCCLFLLSSVCPLLVILGIAVGLGAEERQRQKTNHLARRQENIKE